MRGNLDLRRESFVLGFERTKIEALDRWHAKLVDRGEVEEIKETAAKEQRENKQSKKREEKAAEYRGRRDTILRIARERGHVTQPGAAIEIGCSSSALRPLFQGLVQDGVLRDAKKRGYVLADSERQIDMEDRHVR
jgi:predicted HTH transcriptional regulator